MSSSNQRAIYSRTGIINPRSGIGTSTDGSAATDNRSQADDRGHQDRRPGRMGTRDENILMGHGENIDAEDEIFEGRQLHINCKPKNLLTRLSPPPEHHEPFERDAWRYQNDSFFEGRSRFEKWRGGRVHRGGRPWNRRGFRSRSPLSRNRATDRLPENVDTIKEILIGLKKKDSPDIIIALRNSDIIRKYMEFAQISSDIAKDLLYIVAKGLMSTTVPALAKKLVKIVEEEDLIRTLMQTESCTLPNKAKMIYYVHVLLRRISKITPSNKQYIDRQMQQTNTFIAELNQNEQQIAVLELLHKVDEIKLYLSKFIAGDITDDFSQMKIFPTTCDIENDPFEGLCKNKITSSYTNEFEYLETHFKLMRADCFIPLRNGILEMRKIGGNTRPQRLDDAFIYYNVKIIAPCLANGIGYELVFDTSRSRAKRVRLKYGSLVALSADNFLTYHFATVFDSENKGKGEIQVKFEFTQSADIYALSKNPLTMMEPASGYFESYRHVLSVLQDYAKENITIPLGDYIVYNAPEISPPKYIPSNAKYKLRLATADEEHSFEENSVQFRNETNCESPTSSAGSESCEKLTNVKDADIKYVSSNESGREDKRHSKQAIWFKDLSLSDSSTERKAMFCGNASTLTAFNANVDVFSQTFPSASDLDMDVDQGRAFTNALTKELSIIQGPPGCGKTYVGLKIAEVLLDNNNDKTIMVVCYTNHALDQFMREIIAQNPTSNVVRIGGRSKDEQIQNITLAKKRKMRPNLPDDLFQTKREARNDKNNIRMNLCENMLKSKLIKESIVHHNVLKKQISSTDYTCFEQISYHYGYPALLWWLSDGSSDLSRVFLSSVREDVGKRMLPECVRNIIRDTIKTDVFNQMGLVEYALTDKIALHISELDTHPELRLKYCRHFRGGNAASESGYPDIFDPSFSLAERWKLYRGWVNDYCKQFENEIFNIAEEFEDQVKRVSEICMLVDKHILESADVIGVTTTGAAKNWNLIKEIGPKIVIAEEAAEVFESHLFSSLTPSCQHLILIGDHKQLRPNPAVFRLAREYKLDISLFERMVKNNFPYDELRSQHRMRPEIADIMRIKDLYPGLIDDSCVLCYDPIKGVEGNMFFLDHRNYEEQDAHTRSHINMFEAMFLVELCHYLLLQGYEDSQITILSMYNGQMFKIKHLLQERLNRRSLIRVDNVDNYQGEENDIILLSLVRSNDIGKKGFVGHLNRICVSMSRAKKGLFIIGNKRTLCSGQSKWQSIIVKMCKMNAVNTNITLVCQNHPERKVYVENVEDFMQCPDGGCYEKCTFEMSCGHVCPKHCHSYDRKHNGIVCRQRCQRQCINGHSCRLECNERCPPCMETVVKTLECGHKLTLPCYKDDGEYKCTAMCTRQLQPCGHTCAKKCYESCSPCVERIQVLNEKCQHINEVQCFLSSKSDTCNFPCEKKLSCGHICLKKCSDPCEPCTSKVTYKRDTCSHLAERQCHQLESTDSCQKICDLKLDCGHFCKNTCVTTDKLARIATYGSVSTCAKGHTSLCKERCSYKLACGHQCQGDCKRCDKGRWHMMCDQECNVELLCFHTKRATCNSFSSLMLCQINCAKKCRHTDCKLRCCESCKACEHDCDWGCKHLKCTKRCGENCDRERCNDICEKILAKCGHDCTGLCGDPCPDICFVCDKDVFQEEDFAHRFVQLHDCGDIVRSKEMDNYMDTIDDSWFKACPVCSKPVQTTNANRYEKIVNAQWKAFDKTKTNQTSRTSCDEILFEHIGDTKSSLPLNMQRIKDITNINKNRLKKCLETNCDVDTLPLLQKHIDGHPLTQALYQELERETQRFLHADALVTIVNEVDRSNLPDLQDKLTVATDILDVPGPYTDELQDAFHTYVDGEFPQNVDKAKLMRLRFEWKPIEFDNTDEAVQTLKDVLINECTRLDNDVRLLTLLKWDGGIHFKINESREEAVKVKGISFKTILENRQKRPPVRTDITQKKSSGSKLVIPNTNRQPEASSREGRSTRDSKRTAATNRTGNSQIPRHQSTHNDRTLHGASGYNIDSKCNGRKRALENDSSYHNQDSNSKRPKRENRNSSYQRQGTSSNGKHHPESPRHSERGHERRESQSTMRFESKASSRTQHSNNADTSENRSTTGDLRDKLTGRSSTSGNGSTHSGQNSSHSPGSNEERNRKRKRKGDLRETLNRLKASGETRSITVDDLSIPVNAYLSAQERTDNNHDNVELEDRRQVRRGITSGGRTAVYTDSRRPITDYSDLECEETQ
ncbi:NFX1-type zinc finger-containing protein 1-like isoform X1 [Mya arenaria]|uniref:NFX1-type zinc finger-containing protein 1-like isoform X1 n=1 Tax=Mya arenaria TaxID=6604 RepID=UPI0022DF42B5|nr:NFX1-type zinc finger-containing protein 1-like isoform X1 [Mya arenaria]